MERVFLQKYKIWVFCCLLTGTKADKNFIFSGFMRQDAFT